MWGGESYKAARVTGGESADKKEAFILGVKVEKKNKLCWAREWYFAERKLNRKTNSTAFAVL